MERPAKSRLFAILLVSLLTLAFQLLLTRLLAFVFWHHLVYLIISIALLGYGVSSTLLAIAYERVRALPESVFLGLNLALFAASGLAGLFFLNVLDVDLVDFVQGSLADVAASALPLLLAYLVFLLPFFFAGNVVVYLFFAYPGAANRLYFYDLVGAALGCLLYVPLIRHAGAVGGILLCLLAAVAGSAAVLWEGRSRRGGRLLLAAAAALAAALVALYPGRVFQPTPDSAKLLARAFDPEKNPSSRLEHSAWDVVTRVDVVSGGDAPIDLDWTQIIPGHKLVTFDGDAVSHIPGHSADFPTAVDVAEFEANSHYMPLLGDTRGGDHAVIGLGGGPDLATSLLLRPRSITGVEINAALIEALTTRFADFGGRLFQRPQVRIVHSEGRSFLRRERRSFDLIFMSGVDTFTALNTGAYVLAENYLYTVEAIRDYTSHLTAGGKLFILRWLLPSKPRETLRLFATVLESLGESGVESPHRHVLVLAYQRGFSPGITLVKKSPYTEEECRRILDAIASRHPDFRFLYLPLPVATWARAAAPEARYFIGLEQAYRAGQEEVFFDRYPFDVEPVRDDRPFFFKYYKLSTLFRDTWQAFVSTGPVHGYWSYLVFLLILVTAAAAVALFIWAPLARYRRAGLESRDSALATLYFAALGLGFIMLEIVLMQKFALFLGHPMYSITTVLGGVLLGAGVGSRAAERWAETPARGVSLAFAGVTATVLLLAFTADPALDALLGLDLPLRIAVCAAAVAPLAFFLGFFFPLGLRVVTRRDARYVPWAWGINAGFTVIGSILAILAAMAVGFDTVMLLAAAIYGAGVLAIRRYHARGAPAAPTALAEP